MTIPFSTTPEQIIRLAELVTAMSSAGLDRSFAWEATQSPVNYSPNTQSLSASSSA